MKRKRAASAEVNQPYKRPRSIAQAQMIKKPTLYRSPEQKNIDTSSSTMIVAAATTSQQLLINGVDDGASPIQRIGRRITMTSLSIRFVGALASTTAGGSPIRLAVIYDRQSNGVAPLVTDVFQGDLIATQMNLANSRRFKVIVDENIESLGTAGPQGFQRHIYRKLNLPVEFNDNSTATITSITSGSLYAFVWQNGQLITTAPTHLLNTRVRFVDQ